VEELAVGNRTFKKDYRGRNLSENSKINAYRPNNIKNNKN